MTTKGHAGCVIAAIGSGLGILLGLVALAAVCGLGGSRWFAVPNLWMSRKARDEVKRFDLFQRLERYAERDDAESIEAMLCDGIAPDFRGPGGEAVLHVAARSGSIAVMEALLLGGADIDATDNRGQSALHAAVRMHRVEVVRFLLDAGADRTIRDKDGYTALDWSRMISCDRELELLLNGT